MMAFPTIRMVPPVENPCPHFFPYTVTEDGRADISPCEKCQTPWERRNDDYPNSCVIWSFPRGVNFGRPTPPNAFLPKQDVPFEEGPSWFPWG